MLNLPSILEGIVPAVDSRDLKRFCAFHWQQAAPPPIAYTREAIVQLCQSESADPMAILARVCLLELLRRPESLKSWRDDEEWQQAVFQAVAVFPLPQGLQGLDYEQFLTAMPD